jgi:hypothetical protein
MDPERIVVELKRSGGFAGSIRQARIDTAELDPVQAAQYVVLVDRLDVDELRRLGAVPQSGADRFQYDIAISRGGQRQAVTVSEGAVTEELQVLIDRMLRRTPS